MASFTSSHQLPIHSEANALHDVECEDLYDNEEANGDKDLNNGTKSEVYMGLMWHGGHTGVAYYDISDLQIHVMADTLESDDFVLVKQIVREIQPTVIVLSSLQDNRLLTCLKKLVSDRSPLSPWFNQNACKLEFLPNSDFSYAVSKSRVLAMNLPSVPRHFTDEEKRLYFASLIPLDCVNMIRSVGGLLKYLERSRVGIELEDMRTSVPVLGFRSFSIESLIQIDTITYCALNVFHMELHPSVYKFGSGSCKEGLSLFGILNRCKSSVGSRMLRQWFMRPLRNASVLRQRYDAISFFLMPCNIEIVACLQGCLKHIKYIPKILLRMSKAQATIVDWLALSKTIYHAVYIGETCKAQNQMVEIFRKIGTAFTDDLHRCANIICKTVDFEASKQSKRFVVKANVDDALDTKKRTFNGLPDLMSQVAREELKGLSDDISGCVVSYLPLVGYLLVIDMPADKTEADDHTIEGIEFKFASNNQLFYKSPKTLELDRILGDTQSEIIDMEVKIMHQLQTALLENTQVMLDVMELAAELDCLMALATCASEFGYVRPLLIEEDVLCIKAGRHPLQELCCNPYVPNDTTMGGNRCKISLLTGPNACGKTVYLKQVALIVFMAHIGSYVPAEEARIGAIDKIFSRVKSLESVSGSLSTFMQDIIQISAALCLAKSNSLVVVDEFGKGTDSTDGLALLTAVLKFWIAKGSLCPLVLISTHFYSIIEQNLLPPSPQLQFLTFETVLNREELVFLYQIKKGHTSSSYACNIATQVGMPADIIKRANEVMELLRQNKSIPHMKDAKSSKQNERYEMIVSEFLKLDLDKCDLHTFLKSNVLHLCADSDKKMHPQKIAEHARDVQQEIHFNQSSKEKITRTEKREKSREVEDRNMYAASSINVDLDQPHRNVDTDPQRLSKHYTGCNSEVLHAPNTLWKMHPNTDTEQFSKTPLHKHTDSTSKLKNGTKFLSDLEAIDIDLTNTADMRSTMNWHPNKIDSNPAITRNTDKRKASFPLSLSSAQKQAKLNQYSNKGELISKPYGNSDLLESDFSSHNQSILGHYQKQKGSIRNEKKKKIGPQFKQVKPNHPFNNNELILQTESATAFPDPDAFSHDYSKVKTPMHIQASQSLLGKRSLDHGDSSTVFPQSSASSEIEFSMPNISSQVVLSSDTLQPANTVFPVRSWTATHYSSQ